MTPQEAIAYFKHRLECGQCGKETTQRYAFEEAIKALEKQIPLDVDKTTYTIIKTHDIEYNKTDTWNAARCPRCNKAIALNVYGFNRKHCEHCGQAIDWSDTE